MQAEIPNNEAARLAALRDYNILDTPPEQAFDDITWLASQICGTPISLISLLDHARQWFKSSVGVTSTETPRHLAFCAHAILQDGLFVVPNALEDARFADSPFVINDPHIRFYAGAPLVTPSGHALGTLCVIDRVPRTLTSEQEAALKAMSRQVVALLELHRKIAQQKQEMAVRQLAEQHLRDSKERFFAFMDNSPAVAFMKNEAGRYVYINRNFERLFMKTLEEIQGATDYDLFPEAIADETRRNDLAILAAEHPSELQEMVPTADGALRCWWVFKFPFMDASGERFIGGVALDITARKEAEAALAESDARFRSAICVMQEGFTLQDNEGRIMLCNQSAEQILGLSAAQMQGRTSLDPRWRAIHEDGTEWRGETHPSMRALREGVTLSDVVMGVHKPDGELTWVSINATPLFHPDEAIAYSVVTTFTDITQRRWFEEEVRKQITLVQDYSAALEGKQQDLMQLNARLEEANTKLAQLATTDGLTGLKNHRAFQEFLNQEYRQAVRYAMPLSVILLDVDWFKQYNDTFGHPAGDDVLKQVASLLCEEARASDFVARYGGEEFVVVLPHTDADGGRRMAERFRIAIQAATWPERTVTASFGVASLTPLTVQQGDMMAEADKALYHSKAAGRNCVTHASQIPGRIAAGGGTP